MGLFGRRKKQDENDEKVALEAKTEAKDTVEESTGESSTVDPFSARSTNIFADSTVLEPGTGLHQIVNLMYGKGEGQMTLSLKQNGDDMQLRLYNNGEETETLVVSPETEWFAPVAALYTEEERGDRGEWNRALIVANPPVGDEMAVQASFLNTVERTSHNLKYVLNLETLSSAEATGSNDEQDDAEETNSGDYASALPITGVNQIVSADGVESQSAVTIDDEVDEASAKPIEDSVAQQDDQAEPVLASAEAEDNQPDVVPVAAVASTTAAVVHPSEEESAEKLESDDALTEDTAPSAEETVSSDASEEVVDEELSESSTAKEVSSAEVISSADESTVKEDTLSEESVLVQEPENNEANGEVSEIETTEEATSTVASPSLAPAFNSTQKITPTEETDVAKSADLPEDEKEEMANDLPTSSVSAPETEDETDVATLPEHIDDWAFDDETFDSAPATASAPDVTNAVRRVRVARPSSKKLAEGNLVLSEADVVSRLMPIQDKLFGENGTALDAATVLIRVRTLGSYYDALTHVRRNGFWDQQKTFDLIPEDVLKVLDLKTASYKEGSGAPLAMSLRFTPGVPPVASFDYSSEEAFVQYNDQLPAQQYIEELRMFPRTGANIPAHMSEALASWAL